MSFNRRTFLKQSALASAGASLAGVLVPQRPLLAFIGTTPEPVPPIEDPRLKALVQQSLDSARSAGAVYSDVRLTYSRDRMIQPSGYIYETEDMTIGVRALVDGYWGFASGAVWSATEAVRLGQEATRQAKANTLGKPRVTELASTPVIRDGHWKTPVDIDPFALHPSSVTDILEGLRIYAKRRSGNTGADYRAQFFRQEKAFGSSDGSYYTQQTCRTQGVFTVGYKENEANTGSGEIDFLSPTSAGFEVFDEIAMRNAIDRIVEDIKADFLLPFRPIDVGRYDTVLGAKAVACLMSGTIGAATELDRAIGYEANAGGTSYLQDPPEMINRFVVGSPLLTVTGNRTEPGGAATVQWDDDGVAPHEFPLVRKGILTDYQTTREGANWLTEQYAKTQTPTRSHGCAHAPSAVDAPLAHTANLVMESGVEPGDFDSLISGMKRGLAFNNLTVTTDFQQLNGLGFGSCYEIANGRKVARLANAGMLFRTPELWRSITALGGVQSARRYGLMSQKGQPAQTAFHSVTTVPTLLDKLTIIDVKRKA